MKLHQNVVKLINLVKILQAGNDTPSNPFHGYVDILIGSKC